MADFTITHRIEAPALVEALNNLAAAMKGGAAAQVSEPKVETPIRFATKQEAPEMAVNPTTAVSSVNDPTPVGDPTAPANVAAPSPGVGTEEKPITFDSIVAAGSQLLDAGRMNDLLGLLKGFGVQAITQLKPEQYADVAVALRGLGAKI